MRIKLLAYGFFILLIAPIISGQQVEVEYDESFKQHLLIIEADSLANIWQWEKAIRIYERAKSIFRKQELWEGYYYAMNRIGGAYDELREYDKAYRIIHLALKESKELWGEIHPEMARGYFYRGFYFMRHANRQIDSSLIAFNKALNIRQQILPVNHLDIAESHHLLGRYFNVAVDLYQSRKHHQRGIEIYESQLSPTALKLARSYRYYALTLSDLHDNIRNREYLQRALKIYELQQEVPIVRVELGYIYNNLANEYFFNKEFKTAIPLYEKAIKLNASQLEPLDPYLPTKYANLASAYVNTGQRVKSAALLKLALLTIPKAKEYYEGQRHIVYGNYADYFDVIGLPDSAIVYCLKSIDALKRYPNYSKSEMSGKLSSLALYFAEMQKYQTSLKHIQQALIQLVKDFDNQDIHSNPLIDDPGDPDNLYSILDKKAHIFHQKYVVKKDTSSLFTSIQTYDLLDSLADKMRNELYSEDNKLSIAKYYKETANHALSAIMDAYSIKPEIQYVIRALKFMEKNRYARLYSNQSRLSSMHQRSIPDSLLDKELELNIQMENIRQEIAESNDSIAKQLLQNKKFELVRKFESFQSEISNKYPSYFKVNYQEMLKLTAIQKMLDRNTQIIEYFWGDSIIYVVNVSKKLADLYQITISDALERRLEWMLKFISGEEMDSSDLHMDINYGTYVTESYLLYKELLDPFLIKDKTHVIISLDSKLSFLPLEQLVESPEPNTWRKAPYILRKYDIQYVYSCNWLFSSPPKNLSASPSILAFAYSEKVQSKSKPAIEDDSRKRNKDRINNGFPEIRGSALELEEIEKLFGNDGNLFFKGDSATETKFKELAESYEILHLALHGMGDTLNELNSRLHFRNDLDSLNDGNLFAHELYNLDLRNTSLAVMSACQSGVGKEISGEGIFSMARGFAASGCPSIVMSLWNINDEMTAELMSYFYRHIENGEPVYRSIKKAKLDFIKHARAPELAQPYYWAGFVQLGDTTPVMSSTFKINWYQWISLLIVLLILFAILNKKYRIV